MFKKNRLHWFSFFLKDSQSVYYNNAQLFSYNKLFYLYTFQSLSGSVIMFIAIIRQLGNRDVLAASNTGADKAAQRVRNQVARMLIVNGTVFFLLHLPVSKNT